MSESNIKWTKLSKISTFNDQPEQWLDVKGFEKVMVWLFSKFDKDAKKMMEMEPKPAETFSTKVEDDYVWVGIDN